MNVIPRVLLLVGWMAVGSVGGQQPKDEASTPAEPASPVVREVEGWSVHVDRRLLDERGRLGRRALKLLESKLYEVSRTVPAAAIKKLREVPIWIGVRDRHDRFPCACYHPSAEWLEQNGYNPEKAGSVDILNAGAFVQWSKDQPSMVLHELAHAYHHQVLGYDHPELRAAYRRAVESGSYESVLHISGRETRAYALNNDQEYFAEATEAYFGTNDFYPFVRAELRQHDPKMYRLLETLWGE